MERKTYIQQCLNKHLLKQNYYQLLSKEEKSIQLTLQRQQLTYIYYNYRENLEQLHQGYFNQYFEKVAEQAKRIAQFYGRYKVHKLLTSVRPIISCCGTF